MATEIVWKEMFDAHLAQTDKVVLVDFWAERCGPCRMLKPVLHELSDKRDDVELLTVNVDDAANGDLTMEFSVRSIPQVTIFKDWKSVDQFIGALPPDQIEEIVDKHAGASSDDEEESQEQENQEEQENQQQQ